MKHSGERVFLLPGLVSRASARPGRGGKDQFIGCVSLEYAIGPLQLNIASVSMPRPVTARRSLSSFLLLPATMTNRILSSCRQKDQRDITLARFCA